MIKKLIYLAAFAAVAVTAQSCNDNKRAKNLTEKTLVDDEGLKFILAANEAGLTEINAATLAQKASKNPRVVNFAKMMITDHTTAGNELKKIADEKYVTISDTLSQEHQKMINGLSKQSGAAFDKTYMGMMEMDHAKVIQLFQNVSDNTDKKLQKYSSETTPKLKMHLDSAKAINASLK